MKKNYIKRKLITINEIVYSDGVTRYEILEGKNTSGVYNDIDLLIEVMKYTGKLDKNCKVFISN